MVTVVVFEFSVMRCQPLRRALGVFMDKELQKVFESNLNGDKKNLRVHIINPAIENPWRTKGDYDEEQKEARERHEMLQEQHKVILKSHRCTVVVALAAIVSAVATCLLVYLTYQDLRNNNVVVPKVMVVESVQNPTEPHS
ncbi:TPA: hypothetical protein GRR69_12810 [Vibrio parahaemolyticus]|nr:hypothetical protein CGH57_21600 [Vibrio parahaemolyticus]HAS6483496.1 hypothetical protein [Vibrio parahaemolyticus]